MLCCEPAQSLFPSVKRSHRSEQLKTTLHKVTKSFKSAEQQKLHSQSSPGQVNWTDVQKFIISLSSPLPKYSLFSAKYNSSKCLKCLEASYTHPVIGAFSQVFNPQAKNVAAILKRHNMSAGQIICNALRLVLKTSRGQLNKHFINMSKHCKNLPL